jgi:hypothetical protein
MAARKAAFQAVTSRPAVLAAAPSSVMLARQAAAAAGATVLAPEELQPALHAAALQTKQQQHRAKSLAPGDSTGVICYARFAALLGIKMENLTACAGLINKYFKDTFKYDAFIPDNGTVRVPLTLTQKFVWNKFLNHNARRDIYAA